MNKTLFRTAYDDLQKSYSDASATDFSFPDDDADYHPSRSLTSQSDAADCDMNVIMSRYLKTGLLPQSRASAFYGDASALPDYQQAQQILIDAQLAFESLPSKLRDRFNNSPEKFLEFMSDTDNRDEMERLGLLKPTEEAVPAAEAPPRGNVAKGTPAPSEAQE